MIDAARNFLRLFDAKTPTGERSVEHLVERLDRLPIAYHESTDVAPGTDTEPPSTPYEETRAVMLRCFPDFGFYAWAAPEESPDGAVMMGDAIDDLADIYAELQEVVWLWENSSAADAVWQFHHGYRSHWGRHLLNLRSYLHWKLYEQ